MKDSIKEKLKKFSDGIKKFIKLLIKSPLFRKIVLIIIIILLVFLLFVIAGYLLFNIDSSGSDDSGSVMSKTVSNTLSKTTGIGKRKSPKKKANGEEYPEIEKMDGFLFIGDSGVSVAEDKIKELGSDITVLAVSGSTPGHWKVAKKAGETYNIESTIGSYAKSVTFPENEKVTGISVTLGANGVTNTGEIVNMMRVLDNLLEMYPGAPIFVNSVLYVGPKYTAMDYKEYNKSVDTFNEKIQEYCDNISNLFYIDVSNGLYKDGALNSTYGDDNDLELNDRGNSIFVKNIEDGILSKDEETDIGGYTSTNIVKHIVENGRDGYKIDVNLDEVVEEIITSLREENDGENARLLSYFSDDNREKCLKEFIKAAIVTQYPDLRKKSEIGTEPPEGEIQGIVKVKRRTENMDEDNEGEFLQYIPYEKFEELKNNSDNSIFNYFTLDKKSNMVIAGYEKRTVEPQSVDYGGDPRRDSVEDNSQESMYKITYSTINYIKQVEKYSMPFDLLWTLLVYSEDEDFTYNLAELACKNDIVITVHDNITRKTTVDEYDYTKNVKIHEKATFSDTTDSPAKVGNKTYEGDRDEQYNYKIVNKDYYESNNPILAITYVDSWVAKYENKYKKTHKGPTTKTTETTEDDDNDYVDDGTETKNDSQDSLVNGWKSNYKSLLTSAYNGTDKAGKEKYSLSVVLSYKKKLTDKKKTKTVTTEQSTYEAQPAEVEGKYDPDSEEDNFVTLLRKSKYLDNLRSTLDWLFESIEENESICDMLDLIKFLMGKVYDDDFGVTDFDYSIYKPEKFSSIGGVPGGTIEEKVWYYLRSAGYSEYSTAGVMGNIYGESGFDPGIVEGGSGIGFGLCQWSFGRRTNLENYADSKGVDPSDPDTQIEFLLTEINPSGGAADGYASFIGTAGIYGCDMDGWLNADTVEEATKQFCGWFERPDSDGFYGSSMNDHRIPKAIEYYNQFHGRDLSSFLTGGSGGTIIECAERIHTYMEENGYFYSCDTGLLRSTFEESKSTKAVCCASFVCWVVIDAGYMEPDQMSHGALSAADAIEGVGFTEVSESEMQAGDIISYGQPGAYNGHIEIYAGDGQIYNAGGDESIQMDNPYPKGNGRTDYYKILRAPR